MSKTAAQRTDWHVLRQSELFTILEASGSGLSESEAQSRLARVGPNQLPQRPPVPLWRIVAGQFSNPLIYILAVASVVSVAIGDIKDAIFIAGVLVLNAIIGASQEWKAERSSHALRKLLQIRATVFREGETREINAEAVVPGDIVWMESGNRVPADLRLLSTHGIEIDESLLTGESMAVPKDAGWIGDQQVPLADRRSMAYAGSIVTRGRAKGVVVATGMATSVGQLALDVLGEAGGKPPLLIRMERFTRVIAVAVLVAAAGIATLGTIIGGYTASEMFLFAVALAVSAIPEGLPVAMTVALAVATTRMARRGLIVRRLTAVEGLGSCTLIATDKTGTLTCNELTVRQICLPDGEVLQVTGEGFAPSGRMVLNGVELERGSHVMIDRLVRASVLCNEGDLHLKNGEWVWRGDAVDIALLTVGHKIDWIRKSTLDRYPQVNQIPFEPEHQFAATFHADQDQIRIFVKGSPERVLSMCESSDGASLDIRRLESLATTMAGQGFRVLALADGVLSEPITSSDTPPAPRRLRFLGFAGMIDPLRPGVKQAVEDCHHAGVSVSMVTGDHQITALAIARELGIAVDEQQVVTVSELQEYLPDRAAELLHRVRVFARVTPRQKLQIVEAARQAGQFVAVTGDGVNDAPALRAANIGVAMGKSGTDVAREAAELVISDDNFSTIVAGIEEGRVAYDNIRKVIYLLVSTGAAELVLMSLALATGTPFLPLLPVQILWLNLVTNGIQDVALAFEPNEGDALLRSPRAPAERIFNQLMIERTVIAAVVMGVVGFLTFRWYLPEGATEGEVASARNALLLLMVLFENIHIGNCRSETKSAISLSPLRSPVLLAGTVVAFLVHVTAMHTTFGKSLLQAEPVSPQQWGVLILLALIIFPVMELHKWNWAFRRRHKPNE